MSPQFEGVFNDFIEDLEGSERPLELVAADFLRYSVEEGIRKFCRAVSSERSYIGVPMYSVTEPWECASYLSDIFMDLSRNLSDRQTRALEEEYFRAHLIRESRAAIVKVSTPAKTSTSSDRRSPKNPTDSDRPRETPTKTCAGHFGRQLKAFYADGRPYKCAFGKACKFRHIGKVGKTKQEVLDIIALLPATARADLGTAFGTKA